MRAFRSAPATGMTERCYKWPKGPAGVGFGLLSDGTCKEMYLWAVETRA
jgi:hypothetical protein